MLDAHDPTGCCSQLVEEDVCRREAEGKRFRPGFRVSAQQACTSTQAPPPHESNVTLSIPGLVPAAASATAAWAVAWTFFGARRCVIQALAREERVPIVGHELDKVAVLPVEDEIVQ
ncbi:hypothetical protein EDB85DRAFT_2152166 [Lactarius pseudohatsudake]|nr:hypothetical protein EDB85DRAFT_2152166 [Lactarius pseudohatsudake]